MGGRDLLTGLIRLHILHHAAHEPIFGLGIIEELGRHGYKLSAGTLYPLLHGLEQSGHLRSRVKLVCGRQRRLYVATKSGAAALESAKTKVWELFRELFEEELPFGPPGHAGSAQKGRKAAGRSTAGSPASRLGRFHEDTGGRGATKIARR